MTRFHLMLQISFRWKNVQKKSPERASLGGEARILPTLRTGKISWASPLFSLFCDPYAFPDFAVRALENTLRFFGLSLAALPWVAYDCRRVARMGWIWQRWMETLSATLYVLIKTYQSMKAFAPKILYFAFPPLEFLCKWQNRIITCISSSLDGKKSVNGFVEIYWNIHINIWYTYMGVS